MVSYVDWFSNPGNAALAAFFISLISAFVAAGAMYTSWKTQKRQVEIEEIREMDRQQEMRKADLVARLVHNAKRTLLEIENKGYAEAREILVLLDGRPLSEYQGFVHRQSEIRRVGPNSSFHYLMVFTDSMNLSFEINITWVDDSEEDGRYSTILTY